MNDEQKNKLLQHATNLLVKKENMGIMYELKDAKDEVVNNLFSKEIEVQNILIDTTNFDDHIEVFNKNNFYVNLESFGGPFKNVIGFRLKKTILRNLPWTIHPGNNKIILSDGTQDITFTTESYGYYDESSLQALMIDNTKWTRSDSGGNAPFDSFTINSLDHILTYTVQSDGSVSFDRFHFKKNYDNGSSLQRLLGFNRVDDHLFVSPFPVGRGDYPVDFSTHFLDIVVDEIPYIACKKNKTNAHVIDRIGITMAPGSIGVHQTNPIEYKTQNYFFPIKLNRLTIKIFSDHHDILYGKQVDSCFEFEISMLRNTKLLDNYLKD